MHILLGFLYPSSFFILCITNKEKRTTQTLVFEYLFGNYIDKRMFDIYNKDTEQMFGTVVRGGFTYEK